MKALVVLASPPLPEGGAPGKCAIGLLRGLSEHGVDVRAIAAGQFFTGAPPQGLTVEIVPVEDRRRSYLERIRRPAGELPSGLFAQRVRELAADVDVLHLEQLDTSWCDQGLSAPSVVHLQYLVRRDRPLGPPWRSESRWILERTLAERAALRRHRFVLASSPLIAAQLRRQAPRAHVVHAPLSLDPSLYASAPLDGPPTAGLIGTAGWPTTHEAMVRLIQRVWPSVRRRRPDARMMLAGRGTAMLAGAGNPDGIEVLGDVESAARFLQAISVLVFPLSRGSGMKVKVMEAMACGVPVVTTRAGAEGIDGGDGIVVAEDDEALASATASMLGDVGERQERGTAGRAAFLARYAPGPATAPVVAFYEEMLGR